MRLYRHPVLWPKDPEVERGHDRNQRGGGSLMSADLQPIGLLTKVIGVVNHIGREPEHLALELPEHREVIADCAIRHGAASIKRSGSLAK